MRLCEGAVLDLCSDYDGKRLSTARSLGHSTNL